ncbi:MAG: FadR/GntR family transcriptional regulator [Parvibaculaceae bacterium]
MERNDIAAPQYAIQVIRGMIASGEVRPGEKLPSQRHLSTTLNVSRPALREAISALEMLGVVKASAGRGVFVCEPQDGEWPGKQRQSMHVPGIGEVLSARLSLRPEIAALAAQVIGGNELKGLKNFKDRIVSKLREGDAEKAKETEDAFFAMLREAISPHLLAELDRFITGVDSAAADAPEEAPARLEEKIGEFEAIVEALEFRDAFGAYRAVRRHVLGEASRRGVQIMSHSR